MVYSEHDANFFALDRQLNEEAAKLEWTKSRSHTLSGRKQQDHVIDEYPVVAAVSGRKLGGNSRVILTNPRISSAVAAHNRLLSSLSSNVKEHEPDSHDASQDMIVELSSKEDKIEFSGARMLCEDEQKNSIPGKVLLEYGMNDSPACGLGVNLEPRIFTESSLHNSGSNFKGSDMFEPDPDNLEPNDDVKHILRIDNFAKQLETRDDDFTEAEEVFKLDTQAVPIMSDDLSSDEQVTEWDGSSQYKIHTQRQGQLDVEDHELQRITEPASLVCSRLQHAIENLRSEVTPAQVVFVLQTLSKIIRNVIEHPDDMKFRKLRKANPVFQKNVASFRAAMEVLSAVGFQEDLVLNENGVSEAFVVLKRNDPGLLWLAKSSLEMCSA